MWGRQKRVGGIQCGQQGPSVYPVPTTFFHLIFIWGFFKTFFAALEGKLNGAEFINFASAWNNFDAFGMFHPGMQACRPALPSVQVTVSLRSYHRWGIYTCCWDPECSAIYCFPGVWLVLPLLAEVV